MRRRDFLGASAGAAAWSIAARAQRAQTPLIGYLAIGSMSPFADEVAAFKRGLTQTGFIDGENVHIEYRWAEGHNERLPEFAADLLSRRVTIIAALGDAAVYAAKAKTTTTPIVFMIGGDPVRDGFVASLSQPGGNITGATWFSVDPMPKRLGILHQVIPRAEIIGQLIDQNFADSASHVTQVEDAARDLGLKLIVIGSRTSGDLDKAFERLVQQGAHAIAVGPGGLHFNQRKQIAALAARYAIPAIYPFREFVVEGGLISYGNNLRAGFQWAGEYAGRVLKGEKPARLPVMQSTQFELVINKTTAKTLGIEIPLALFATADDVI